MADSEDLETLTRQLRSFVSSLKQKARTLSLSRPFSLSLSLYLLCWWKYTRIEVAYRFGTTQTCHTIVVLMWSVLSRASWTSSSTSPTTWSTSQTTLHSSWRRPRPSSPMPKQSLMILREPRTRVSYLKLENSLSLPSAKLPYASVLQEPSSAELPWDLREPYKAQRKQLEV